jgi:uncharacterized protein YyaL (SSP411 family)
MPDVEREIESLQAEIAIANEAIAEALRKRKAINNDSPLVADLNAAVAAAAVAKVVEIKMRQLYEARAATDAKSLFRLIHFSEVHSGLRLASCVVGGNSLQAGLRPDRSPS